jgi:AraC-like DNA-binding protein
VLRSLLITRQSSLEQVAELFSMHRRTLNRRLEEQNHTFQKLVNEIRYEIARQLLENTRLSMGQIAAILDYSDASVFTRAFRRWSGTTPTAWQSQSGARD